MVQIWQACLASVLFTHGGAQQPCKEPASPNCFEPCLVCGRTELPGGSKDPWLWWKTQHNKSYDSAETESFRYETWVSNTQFMMDSNAQNKSFSLGWNEDSDLTAEERTFLEGGDETTTLTDVLGSTYRGEHSYEGKVEDLPSDVDWSEADTEVVTYVKHQQGGDCWAHSATGCLEGALAVANGWTQSLSVQQLVDCSGAGDDGRRRRSSGQSSGRRLGGHKDKAMDWVQQNYACSWDSYPETGSDNNCNWSCDQVITAGSVYGTYTITPYDEGSLCSGLTERPIAISVSTGDAFHAYSSGIFSESYPSSTSHAILAVGYGYWNGHAYWKVKNSWGKSWGLDGYALLYRGGGSDQNLILSKPVGVYVYGPYNPSLQLTNAEGLKVTAPIGSAPSDFRVV